MRVGRPYLAVLSLAIVGLGAFLLSWSGHRSAPPTPSARQLAALESDALGRLHLPSRFEPLRRGCLARRCYVVAIPATQAAAEMPGLLRSAGFQPLGALRVAEPLAMLRQAHWSTGSTDPLVIACKGKAPMTKCQDAGRVGQTVVNVLVIPFQPCNSQRCADPGRAEVLTWAVADPTTS